MKKDGSETARTVSPDIGSKNTTREEQVQMTSVPGNSVYNGYSATYQTNRNYTAPLPSVSQQFAQQRLSPPVLVQVAVPTTQHQYNLQPVVYTKPAPAVVITSVPQPSNVYLSNPTCNMSRQYVQPHSLIPRHAAYTQVSSQRQQPVIPHHEGKSVAEALNTVLNAGRRVIDPTRYDPTQAVVYNRMNIAY